MRAFVITVLMVACLCGGVAAQHIIMNSDTEQVMLCVDLLRLSMQQADRDNILMITGEQLTVGDAILDRDRYTALIDSTFAVACRREAAAARPPEFPAAGFWDFSIENIDADVRHDSCFVSCRLRLYASMSVDGKLAEADETMVFVRHGKGWRLEKVSELFQFLVGGESK